MKRLLLMLFSMSLPIILTRADDKIFPFDGYEDSPNNECNEVHAVNDVSCAFNTSSCCWYPHGGSSELKLGWTLSNSTNHQDIPKPQDGDGFLILYKLNDTVVPLDIYWSPKFLLISSLVNLSFSVFCGEGAELRIVATSDEKESVIIEPDETEICDVTRSWINMSFDFRDFEDLQNLEGAVCQLMFNGQIEKEPLAVRNVKLKADENTISTSSINEETISTSSISEDTISISSLSKDSTSTSSIYEDTTSTSSINEDTTSTSSFSEDTTSISSINEDTSSTSSIYEDTTSISSFSENTISTSSFSENTISTSSFSENTISTSSFSEDTISTSSFSEDTIATSDFTVTQENFTNEQTLNTLESTATEYPEETTNSLDLTNNTNPWSTNTINTTDNISFNDSSNDADLNTTIPTSVTTQTTEPSVNLSNKMDTWEIGLLFTFTFFSLSIVLVLIVKLTPCIIRRRKRWILHKGVSTSDSIFGSTKYEDIKMKSFGTKT